MARLNHREQFDDIINTEFLGETSDMDRDMYALQILFLNTNTSERRTTVMCLSYDLQHVTRMRHALRSLDSPLLMRALRKEYPTACALHWLPIGVRIMRLAEIPF
jgi:hypothetical protein